MTLAALRHIPVLRVLIHRPRLMISIFLGVVAFAALPMIWPIHLAGRLLVSYNLTALVYLSAVGVMMNKSDVNKMRWRSQMQDDGKIVVLLVVIIGSLASLVAIAAQLSIARDLQGFSRIWHIGLAACTVFTSWAFIQVMFALHYAHEFFHHRHGSRGGGLEFPGSEEPCYMDFLYFACVIGTSGQTADVSISNAAMRRLALLHCVLAYFFNATVLALTINIAASLL